jgi:hypothetical protein
MAKKEARMAAVMLSALLVGGTGTVIVVGRFWVLN